MVKASNGATSNFLHDEWGVKDPSSDSDSPKTYVGGLGVHDDTADTGLLYMRQRHYDPTLARFLSRDPIGFAGGLNLYGYTRGRPVSYIDPEGLQEWDPNNYNPYVRREEDYVLTDEQFDEAMARWETTANVVVFAASSSCPDPSDVVGGLVVAGALLLRGLGKYRKVKGHHVHSKAAFQSHPKYDLNEAVSISQKYMQEKGWSHQKMTNFQRMSFKAIDQGALPNTMKTHTAIAVEALVEGGATRPEARNLVAKSLQNLRAQGVYFPTDVPWYGRQRGTFR